MRPIRPQPAVIRPHTMLVPVIHQQAGINQTVDNRLARQLQIADFPSNVVGEPEQNLDARPTQTRQPRITAMHSRQTTPPLGLLILGVPVDPVVQAQVLRFPRRRRHRDPELPYQLTHGSTGPSQYRAPDAPHQSSRRRGPGAPPCGPRLSPRRIPCRTRRRPSAGLPSRSGFRGLW